MNADLPKLAEMQDILDLKGIQVWDWSIQVITILAVLIIAIACFIYWKFFRGRHSNSKIEVPPTPLAEALARLSELVDSGWVESGKIREFYFSLSEIFRDFLEKETGIYANEATQEELRPLLKSTEELTQDELNEAYWFIECSDFVKFAKYVPSKDEWVRSVKVCRVLISSIAQRRAVKRQAIESAPQPVMS